MHPRRGRHRRNRAHLETQSLAAVLVGGGGAWPDNEPTHRAHISDQAPLVWRAPEGPEGTGGLRDRSLRAAGSRAAGPSGARNTSGAASNKLNREFRLRRPWAAAGPGRHHTAPKAPPVWRVPEGPRARLRRPWAVAGPGRASSRRAERSSQRGRLAGGPPPTGAQSSPAPQGAAQQAISGSRAPSGSPTLRQHPSARAGAPNRRQPARGPRPRR